MSMQEGEALREPGVKRVAVRPEHVDEAALKEVREHELCTHASTYSSSAPMRDSRRVQSRAQTIHLRHALAGTLHEVCAGALACAVLAEHYPSTLVAQCMST